MNPLNLIEAIGQFFYWLIYLVNPEFREEEKIKEIERKQHQKLVLEIEKKKVEEKNRKAFEENRFKKISNNEELIEICLDDPVFCDNNEILKEKIQDEIKDAVRRKIFEDEWKNTFKNINYGCYCRNEINSNLYVKCPIDDDSLDLACKERQDCLTSEGKFWVDSNICNTKFLSFLETIPYSDKKNLESFSNEDVLIFTSNKYKALLKIQNKFN
ncbi:glycine/betaine ABC transporter permease [Leptospira meyeri]|uniref:glycine/betaine ABC transporter permease n=1 Tax=Leptospira meyeri TaxID=29508 RepID=UPI001083C2A9|nr:glycine/betaine ABC transporter permease [Leptospira meyeri]MCW7488284.1 glycine/betaine ABC transporter permease [Leptospira meyeri]TGL15257.1 glycine/betaine ABC transporter permease [Leptospira meyeri]